MITALRSTFRIATVAAMLLTLGAIGVARIAPGPDGRTPRSLTVSGLLRRFHSDGPSRIDLVDAEAGVLRSLPLPAGELIDLASGSPWADPTGQLHVVGRWSRTGEVGLEDTGIARIAYPSGRVLDRVAIDVMPVSPPCWASGTRARVFFVAGDGALYRYDFEDADGRPTAGAADGLVRLRWNVEPPGVGTPMILDVARPEAGVLNDDLVLASICPRTDARHALDKSAPKHYLDSEIWWLRLGGDDGAVVGCGPVTTADPAGFDVRRHRPALALGGDGVLRMAYLSNPSGNPGNDLRIAPVAIEPESGTPRMEGSAGTLLHTDCFNDTPAFASDGAEVLCLSRRGGAPTLHRAPVGPPTTASLAVLATIPVP